MNTLPYMYAIGPSSRPLPAPRLVFLFSAYYRVFVTLTDGDGDTGRRSKENGGDQKIRGYLWEIRLQEETRKASDVTRGFGERGSGTDMQIRACPAHTEGRTFSARETGRTRLRLPLFEEPVVRTFFFLSFETSYVFLWDTFNAGMHNVGQFFR